MREQPQLSSTLPPPAMLWMQLDTEWKTLAGSDAQPEKKPARRRKRTTTRPKAS